MCERVETCFWSQWTWEADREENVPNTSPFFLSLRQAPSQKALRSTCWSCELRRRLDPNLSCTGPETDDDDKVFDGQMVHLAMKRSTSGSQSGGFEQLAFWSSDKIAAHIRRFTVNCYSDQNVDRRFGSATGLRLLRGRIAVQKSPKAHMQSLFFRKNRDTGSPCGRPPISEVASHPRREAAADRLLRRPDTLARNHAFFGGEVMAKVRKGTVVVVGCGRVGSWAAGYAHAVESCSYSAVYGNGCNVRARIGVTPDGRRVQASRWWPKRCFEPAIKST
ncbi:hypothetical protein B0H14DRAFT_2601103 [Mycena olivaceomarginata]|nr:hypothetical protein B0H14DRAFT_2601103 [Mycena olivaceomarginata]